MDRHVLHTHARFTASEPEPLSLGELRALGDKALHRRNCEVDAWVAGTYVDHEQTIEAAAAMAEVVYDNGHSHPGAKTLIGVTGPNNVGKSTFARRWALNCYREAVGAEALSRASLPVWEPEPGIDADLTPVVWTTLSSAAAKTALDIELLAALGHRVTKAPPVHQTIQTFARHGVRVVVVDDVHFLRTRDVWGRQALDHVKKLNTELGEHHMSMVLVGANLDGGELFADPQISGRLRVVRLQAFTVDTKAGQLAWQRLLKQFETVVLPLFPGTKEGAIYGQAGLVWRRTQGYLRDAHALVTGVCKLAARNGTWSITPELLRLVPLSERAALEEAALERQYRRGTKAS